MALTGQVPFGAPTLSAVLKKKLADDLIAPRKLVPTLSAPIDWAVRRALMSDPELRPASCLELIAALTAVSGASESRTSGKSGRPDRQQCTKDSPSGRERRAAERFACTRPNYCTISQPPHNQQQWEAQVRNLSTNGIGLLLSRQFEPGSALTVHLQSNNGQVRRTREILVVRVEPAEGRLYLAGKLMKSLTRDEVRGLLEAGANPRPAEPAAAPRAAAPCFPERESDTQASDKPAYIGPYEVLETIGSGATATVYKGRQQQTGTVVAIKVSHGFTELDPEALERFKREFTAINQLRHPHLVRALSMGQDRKRGFTFVAMEYVPGQNLEQHVKAEGAFTPEVILPIFLQVAEGLRYLHANHFVHRDIKPSNILLDSQHNAKLADFGLLKDLTAELQLTPAGKSMGTMEFGAPEQFEDAKQVDRRCDLYSLAASLFYALTGHFPFGNGSQLQIMQRKVHNQFVPLRLLLPSLDPDIDRLVSRCLEPRPSMRLADCDEFIAVLKGCIARPASVAASAPENDPPTIKLGSGAERRASVRFAIDLTATLVTFHQKMRGRWDVTILDVSAAGIRLESPRSVAVNSVLEVKLGARMNSELVLVRWVRPGPGQTYVVGCSFVRSLPEQELEAICQAGAPETTAGIKGP
jgi:serine/threonine protein kinase